MVRPILYKENTPAVSHLFTGTHLRKEVCAPNWRGPASLIPKTELPKICKGEWLLVIRGHYKVETILVQKTDLCRRACAVEWRCPKSHAVRRRLQACTAYLYFSYYVKT